MEDLSLLKLFFREISLILTSYPVLTVTKKIHDGKSNFVDANTKKGTYQTKHQKVYKIELTKLFKNCLIVSECFVNVLIYLKKSLGKNFKPFRASILTVIFPSPNFSFPPPFFFIKPLFQFQST